MVNRRASLAPQGLIPTLHSHVLAPLVFCVALGLILGSVGYFCACTFLPHEQSLHLSFPILPSSNLFSGTRIACLNQTCRLVGISSAGSPYHFDAVWP